MKDHSTLLPALSAVLYLLIGVQGTGTQSARNRNNLPCLQHAVTKEANQQDLEGVQNPSISIAIPSHKLNRTTVVVKVRIENTTSIDLYLSEPSSFFLELPEGSDLKRITESYSASARLWECLSKASQLDNSWVLPPGKSFECKIDITKLNWGKSKSSVYNSSPTYPAGNLFYEVPSGSYKLVFALQSPQELIRGLPKVHLFRSNEVSVLIER